MSILITIKVFVERILTRRRQEQMKEMEYIKAYKEMMRAITVASELHDSILAKCNNIRAETTNESILPAKSRKYGDAAGLGSDR